MTERSYLRLAGVAGMAGAVVALVANAASPRYNLDSFVQYQKIAASSSWRAVHLGILVALILAMVAMAAVARQTGAHLGGLFVGVGGAVAIVWSLIDGWAFPEMAKEMVREQPQFQASAYWGTHAVDWLTVYLGAGFALLFLGVAPLLLGLGQRRGVQATQAGPWYRWLAVGGGAVCVVAGMMELFDTAQTVNDIVFAVGSVAVTVWLFCSGLELWQAAGGA